MSLKKCHGLPSKRSQTQTQIGYPIGYSCFYEVQEQTKQTDSGRTQNINYLWGGEWTRREPEGTLQGAGNALSPDLGGDYTGTYICKNSPRCTLKRTALCGKSVTPQTESKNKDYGNNQ